MLPLWPKTRLLPLACLTLVFPLASNGTPEDSSPAKEPAPMETPASGKVTPMKVPTAVKSPGPIKGTGVATEPAAPRKFVESKRYESMIEVTKVYPTIFYELRYATTRNFTHQQIYPTGARCLLRQSVALRLQHAQEELRLKGYGLKIWDAYRPAWAHEVLWEAAPDPEFVAAPSAGGSWHSWGAAVDVTLVDLKGREQKMPTDFDDFTPAAMWRYTGNDPFIREHLFMLQTAMREAGFYGLRSEWWHFAIDKWQRLMPPEEAKRAAEAMGQTVEGAL
jgi:D-alanyl-D-alanine dipeptidase